MNQIDWTNIYDGSDNDEKFREFHKENPHVYETLVFKTRQLVDRGHKKVGIKMLFEVLRWDFMLKTSDEPFKINNNYAPYYSRMIMENHPEWDGLFEVRAAAADTERLGPP